jgi:acyl phosphate:glycerol-3-phosphate acyltransferase
MTFNLMLFALASYLLGSVPTGLILAKMFSQQDIRKTGSGNIGATNVTRVLGRTLGAFTFAGDLLKGFLPLFIGALIFQPLLPAFTFQFAICGFGFAAFTGHLFPIYLKFKGGKGVATALGMFVFIEPAAVPVVLALFTFTVFTWRYVSLGSLTAAAAMPFVLLIIAFFLHPVSLPGILLSIIAGVFIFIKHKPNIQRLLRGTESRI